MFLLHDKFIERNMQNARNLLLYNHPIRDDITYQEIAQHNKEYDGWIAYLGDVP